MTTPIRRPPPSTQLVNGLKGARERGLEFDAAWDEAWAAVIWPHSTPHRRQWKAALRTAKPEMGAAYRNLPTRTARLFRDLDLSIAYADDGEVALDTVRAAA